MGSKNKLLRNGLGDILLSEATNANRVVDLFCGGSSVSWFAATRLKKPILAYDLQSYAVTLAAAVVNRSIPLTFPMLDKLWLNRVKITRIRLKGWRLANELDSANVAIGIWKQRAEELCSSSDVADTSTVCRCYGGHYFSPTQALTFDAMLRALPKEVELRNICLAAAIIAASECAAAPGHTAQPFKANASAGRYLDESWSKDPLACACKALIKLVPLHALVKGDAIVGDANEVAKALDSRDLVFIDPPYSNVQYSRFYHVLETIARGRCKKVDGVGRYPKFDERPNSRYSRKSSSLQAINDLLQTLATNGCSVILTFPKFECSNGLSGEMLEDLASQYFSFESRSVYSQFSTLGGNKINRTARQYSDELILVLRPK